MFKLISILILVFARTFYCQPYCSAFVIHDNNVLVGKNLDWDLGNGIIILNPRGREKKSYTSSNKSEFWTSKYSSLTFNHFGVDMPLGGINEEGLVVEELSTWPVQYPLDSTKFILNEFEWIQYQLDNFGLVDEVISNLQKISIDKFYFDIHYLLADKFGSAAVIEFINGEPKVYSGSSLPHATLTNNNYEELIRYSNLVPKTHLNKLDVNNSQDRFLKILNLINTSDWEIDSLTHVFAIKILDSVCVSDTRWSLVYDISGGNVYYKTKENAEIKIIPLQVLEENRDYFLFKPIDEAEYEQFSILSSSENNQYLRNLQTSLQNLFGENMKTLIELIEKLIYPIFDF